MMAAEPAIHDMHIKEAVQCTKFGVQVHLTHITAKRIPVSVADANVVIANTMAL